MGAEMEYNIKDFGAVGDGITLDTAAIQSAIDACSISGGRVTIPAGDYLVGTLRLKSRVELHLAHGSRLVASQNMEDYNALDEYPQNHGISTVEKWAGYHLIICVEERDVAITGSGTIDGNAERYFGEISNEQAFYPWRRGCAKLTQEVRPGQLITFVESENVTVKDITVKNTPCWACFIHGCDYVRVSGIKITSPYYRLNTDGLDIDSCRYVTVSDCTIDVGDDAIALRGSTSRLKNKERALEYVSVTGCILSSNSSAIRVGVGTSPIRHIRISNVVIKAAGVGINFFPEWASSSHTPIEDVHFDSISATDVGRMIELNVNKNTPVKNVSISRITAESMSAVRLICTTVGAVEGFRIADVDIFAIKDIDAPVSRKPECKDNRFFIAEGIENLTVKNCRLAPKDECSKEFSGTVCIENCTGDFGGIAT